MRAALLLAMLVWISTGAKAANDTLYAATVRSVGSSSPVAGNLFEIDAGTGVATFVAPIRVGGGTPIGVTGLAIHPSTGVIYGVTSGSSPNHPSSLVTINRIDGEAQLVGPLGVVGSDIAFDANGTLYVWVPETGRIGRVDIATGKVTPVGVVGRTVTTGGLAIDPAGKVLVAGTGASGTLDTLDPATGRVVASVMLKGAPYPAGINSLAVAAGGWLYAVNTNLGVPAQTMLLRVNAATGEMFPIRALPDDTDALVFAPARSLADALPLSIPTLAFIALLILAGIATAAYLATRRRR